MAGTTRIVRLLKDGAIDGQIAELITLHNVLVGALEDMRTTFNAANGGAIQVAAFLGHKLQALQDSISAPPVDGSTPDPTTPTPTSIAVNAGDAQSATVATAVSTPLSVLVTDATATAVPNVTVLWTSDDPTAAFAASSVTNASGIASLSYTVGTVAGNATVTATVTGVGSTTFTVTTTAGAAAEIAAVTATDQSGSTSTAVADPPGVIITDAYQNPVSGTTVTFAVTAGSGSRSPATVDSGSDGTATLTSWTLGAAAGANTLTATAAGLTGSPVTFSANAVASTPTQIAVTAGGAQTGVVAGQAASAITVTVKDAGNNAVEGVTVAFVVTSGNGSLSVASAVTDASGQASVTYTTHTTVETATITASFNAGSVSTSTTVASTFGTAAKLAITTEPASNGASGTALPGQPVITVQDANGNTVTTSTATITASVQSGNATISANSTQAAVAGVATFTTLTLVDTDGGVNVIRFSSGALTVADSAGTTLAPPVPVALQWVTQPGNVTTGQASLGGAVWVVDSSNVVVPGATNAVTVALTTPGGATLSGTLTVNASSGVATFSGLAVDTAGTYTLTATSTGLTSAVSTSFTVTDPSSGGHPNEPAGMTALTDQPWDALPPVGSNDAYGWKRNSTGNNSIQTDATAPVSPSNVLRVQYPTSLNGGTAPEQIVYTISGTAVKRLYLHFQIYVDPNWTNNGNTQTKLLFFCQHDSKNHYIEFIQGSTGTGPMFRYQAQHNDSGASNSTGTSSFNATASNKGRWLDVEVVIYTGTAGGANGTYDLWVDGVKRATNTGITFFLAAQAGKEYWNTIYLNSTYGGGANKPPQALYFQIDHFYASAKAS